MWTKYESYILHTSAVMYTFQNLNTAVNDKVWLDLDLVLLTSLGKTVFAWRFILNQNILFWLTISYQKPFVFSVSVFCSQIFTLKLNLRWKIGLTYAISIVKWFFEIFVRENIFYFSLLNLNYWCFTTILWKFQKKWTSRTSWKLAPRYLPYRFLHDLASVGKSENIWFFINQWLE